MSTTFTMRIDENQKSLISEFAAVNGKSMSEFMLDAALAVIEDAIDLRDWRSAKEEFEKNPVSYSNEEIMKEYDAFLTQKNRKFKKPASMILEADFF